MSFIYIIHYCFVLYILKYANKGLSNLIYTALHTFPGHKSAHWTKPDS